MTKRKKADNSSTAVVAGAKKGDWEEYFNTTAFAMAPANNEFKKRLAITLVEWARKTTEPLDMDDFCDEVGVPPRTFSRWVTNCPELSEANEFAKRRLACLRLKNGIKGEWNWAACRFTLPIYGERYVEHEKALAAIQKPDIQPTTGTTYILVDKIPESDLVPKRDS